MAVDRWQHHLNSLGVQSAVKCQAAVDEFENFCSLAGRAVVFESLYEFAVAQRGVGRFQSPATKHQQSKPKFLMYV
jgi:hypothetical protein